MANSKLTKFQKVERKEMIEEYIDNQNGFFHTAHGVTLLLMPINKMTKMSVSIMSDDETKFRRKVGEYRALCKMYDEHYVTIPTANTDPQNLSAICWAFTQTPGI